MAVVGPRAFAARVVWIGALLVAFTLIAAIDPFWLEALATAAVFAIGMLTQAWVLQRWPE